MKMFILVATHKKYRMPSETCYVPVHVGKSGKSALGYQGDDTGENISWKNPYYCELTGLYWMWKNVDADIVGLVHYRRYFKGSKRAKDRLLCILSEKEIRKYLQKYDMILPRRRKYYIETIFTHYAHTHYAEHLYIAEKVIAESSPEYLSAFNKVMRRTWGHMFNMFIMTQRKCDEYCEWLFPILIKMEERINAQQYDPFQARLFGRVSEILLDVWVEKNGYSYKEIPIISMEKTNWLKKGKAFLLAKFFGKKYDASF